MEYCLRRAEEKDYAAINDLFMEMLRTIYKKNEVQGYKEGELDHYFSGGEDWICVTEKNGSIVALLSVEVRHEEVNYLYYDDFCVREEYRGMGIGTALMDAAENSQERSDLKTSFCTSKRVMRRPGNCTKREGFPY